MKDVSPRILKYKEYFFLKFEFVIEYSYFIFSVSLAEIKDLIKRISTQNKRSLLDIIKELNENHKECIKQEDANLIKIDFAIFNKKAVNLVNKYLKLNFNDLK